MNIKQKTTLVAMTAATLLFTGCANQPQYTGSNASQNQTQPLTMGIDRQDFEKAASEAVDSLLRGKALNKPGGGRYVVMMARLINDTTQRIDTDMLMKKIRIAMLQSGKAVVTTAVKAGGAEDMSTYEVRKLRGNSEFKQSRIAKKGSLIAPDMSLGGKIMQRTAKGTNGNQIVEYYFQLTLTHLETGLAFWEGETVIGKSGSNDTVTW